MPAILNSLLAALPRKSYLRLLPGLTTVDLVFGDVLYEPGEPMREVYFPSQSLVSLLTLVEGHLALEVGMVGREGILDDRGLEAACCSCYQVVKDMHDPTRA